MICFNLFIYNTRHAVLVPVIEPVAQAPPPKLHIDVDTKPTGPPPSAALFSPPVEKMAAEKPPLRGKFSDTLVIHIVYFVFLMKFCIEITT